MELTPFARPNRPIEQRIFHLNKHGYRTLQPATLSPRQIPTQPAPEPPPPDSPPPEPGPDITQSLVRHFNRLFDHADGHCMISTTYPKLAALFGLKLRQTYNVMVDLEILGLVRKVSALPHIGSIWEIMHSAHIITPERPQSLTKLLTEIMTCAGCMISKHHDHDRQIINALHSIGFRDAPKILAKVGPAILIKTLRGIESVIQAGKYVRNLGGFLRWCLTRRIIPSIRERIERVRKHIEQKITRLEWWTKRAKEIGYDAAMDEMRVAPPLLAGAG